MYLHCHSHGAQLSNEDRRALLLAALLLPLRQLQAAGAKGKPGPASAAIIRDSLKWRNKDVDSTAALHEAAPELLKLYELLQAGAARDERRHDGLGAGGPWPVLRLVRPSSEHQPPKFRLPRLLATASNAPCLP